MEKHLYSEKQTSLVTVKKHHFFTYKIKDQALVEFSIDRDRGDAHLAFYLSTFICRSFFT